MVLGNLGERGRVSAPSAQRRALGALTRPRSLNAIVQSVVSSAIFWYAARAWSYAFSASASSSLRMAFFFSVQHFSVACKHHSADFLLARIGLSSTTTKTR